MVKELILKGGAVALVDDEDYERVAQHKWRPIRYRGSLTTYAIRSEYLGGGRANPRRRAILLHREVAGAGAGAAEHIDHENRDGLDNRRSNLRRCTRSQNSVNWERPRTISPYRGIAKTRSAKWQARIATAGGRPQCLGTFALPEDAARAYDAAAKRLHGEFAVLNFPD